MFDWIFEWFQRRCPHSDFAVRADILEGELRGQEVKWCLRCGAWRRAWDSGRTSVWNEPRATWPETR